MLYLWSWFLFTSKERGVLRVEFHDCRLFLIIPVHQCVKTINTGLATFLDNGFWEGGFKWYLLLYILMFFCDFCSFSQDESHAKDATNELTKSNHKSLSSANKGEVIIFCFASNKYLLVAI